MVIQIVIRLVSKPPLTSDQVVSMKFRVTQIARVVGPEFDLLSFDLPGKARILALHSTISDRRNTTAAANSSLSFSKQTKRGPLLTSAHM